MKRRGARSWRAALAWSMLAVLLAGGSHAIAAQLTLSWTAGSTDEAGFAVERSIGDTSAFGEIARTGPGITSYVDVGLGDATTYCYRVRAFNDTDYSDYSNAACGTTRQSFGLAVLKVGAGGGTVTSAPAGIACGAACSASYASGTVVTLSASPNSSSTFAGWSGGGCAGTAACVVTLAAAATVTAAFAPQSVALSVTRAGNGYGSISSAPDGIACGGTCTTTFPAGTSVALSAVPAPGSTFTGWSGACSGSGACTVALSTATTVTATFTADLTALTVAKAGSGGGTVTSAPTGIACGSTCSTSFSSGTSVALSATADPGSSFAGWIGGSCSGLGSCMVTLSTATLVTAKFDAQPVTLTVAKSGAGSGAITSTPPGITCGAVCSGTYPFGTTVTLDAAAAAGSSFGGWGSGCSSTGSCTITLTAPTTVSAMFAPSVPNGFTDDFDRPNSAIIGAGWATPRGTFFLQGGALWNGSQVIRHLATPTPLIMTTGHLGADFTSLNNNGGPAFGLVFGLSDPSNYYAAYRQAGGTSQLKIVRVVNGVETVLASKVCTNPARGVAFHLAVAFAADRVTLSVGTLSVSASGLAIPPGGVGLMVYSGGASHTIDNFQALP